MVLVKPWHSVNRCDRDEFTAARLAVLVVTETVVTSRECCT